VITRNRLARQQFPNLKARLSLFLFQLELLLRISKEFQSTSRSFWQCLLVFQIHLPANQTTETPKLGKDTTVKAQPVSESFFAQLVPTCRHFPQMFSAVRVTNFRFSIAPEISTQSQRLSLQKLAMP